MTGHACGLREEPLEAAGDGDYDGNKPWRFFER
jgi:hypothetical protein